MEGAGFTEYEFRDVIEMLRSALLTVWIEEFGKPPISISGNEDPHDYGSDFDNLKRLMKDSTAQSLPRILNGGSRGHTVTAIRSANTGGLHSHQISFDSQ